MVNWGTNCLQERVPCSLLVCAQRSVSKWGVPLSRSHASLNSPPRGGRHRDSCIPEERKRDPLWGTPRENVHKALRGLDLNIKWEGQEKPLETMQFPPGLHLCVPKMSVGALHHCQNSIEKEWTELTTVLRPSYYLYCPTIQMRTVRLAETRNLPNFTHLVNSWGRGFNPPQGDSSWLFQLLQAVIPGCSHSKVHWVSSEVYL